MGRDNPPGGGRVAAQQVGDSAWLVEVDGVTIPATYYENNHGHLFTFPSENGIEVQAGLDEDGTWLVSAEGPMDEPWNPHLFRDGVIYVVDSSRSSEEERLALSLFAHTILHARSGDELVMVCRQLAEAPVRPLAEMYEAQQSGDIHTLTTPTTSNEERASFDKCVECGHWLSTEHQMVDNIPTCTKCECGDEVTNGPSPT